MPSPPILNPDLPFVGEVEGGLTPGKMVKVQGKVPDDAVRFALNYQLGPGLNPRDDIAIHVCPRFTEGFITRNHIQSMTWGHEENFGPMVIQPGQEFEIIILCHFTSFKIAINGQHYADFRYRLPYQMITHFVVDGDVEVSSIFFEVIPIGPPPSAPPLDVPEASFGPPQPGGIYPTIRPDEPSGGYRPGPQPGMAQKYEEEEQGSDIMDKIGLAVGGLMAAGGAAALANALHKRSQQNQEDDHEKKSHGESQSGLDLGALGAALASSLAANSMQNSRDNYPSYPAFDPNSTSGVIGSLLGALGGAGKGEDPGSHGSQPGGNPLGALSSILGGGSNSQGSGGGFGALSGLLGGVLGGGGKNHQSSGDYTPSGGYGPPPQQHGSDILLSGIGASLFSSAFDSFTKPKDRPRSQPDYQPERTQPYDQRYDPAPPVPRSAPPAEPNPPHSSGGKMSAADISRGLGLGDDDE